MTTDIAIRVSDLGKEYAIGQRAPGRDLREAIVRTFRVGRNSGNRPMAERIWALRDISFEVPRGAVVGIIGKNGAGKSTLLKILSRVTEPTEGRAEVFGRLSALLEVGTGFHPDLTGRENVYLNGSILGMKKSQITSKLDEIVGFAELERFIDTPVKYYSSGMFVRLAFAVAAHLESDILIVDEVLAVGDLVFQKKCLGKIEQVTEVGRTVVFVSHSMAAVRALCKTGLLLENGSIACIGPIDGIIGQYVSQGSKMQSLFSFNTNRRTGNGMVRITNLKVRSVGLKDTVLSNLPMQLRLEYSSARENMSIHFSLGIYDGFRNRILYLDSSVLNEFPRRLPTCGSVVVDFPQGFSLYPDRYFLNVAATVNGEIADHLEDVMIISVEPGDFYGSGRLPSIRSAVLCQAKWILES